MLSRDTDEAAAIFAAGAIGDTKLVRNERQIPNVDVNAIDTNSGCTTHCTAVIVGQTKIVKRLADTDRVSPFGGAFAFTSADKPDTSPV